MRRLFAPGGAALAAFTLRLAATLITGSWRNLESFEQETIVRNLVAGRGLTFQFLSTTYRSFHSNLVSDAIAAFVYVVSGGSETALLVAQWCAAALLALVLGRLGARLGGPRPAALGAWLYAVHPALLIYDTTKLHQVTFDALLVALFVLSLARWRERSSYRAAALAGLLAALCTYERASIALFVIAGALWVRHWRGLPVYALVIATVIAPWTIRNAYMHHRFIPLTTQAGLVLWKGNHEGATGTEFTSDGRPMLYALPPALKQRLSQANTELAQMDLFGGLARDFIRAHPGTAVQLYLVKLYYFWWRSPATGHYYWPWYSDVYQAWYTLLFSCGAYGAWVCWRNPLVRLILLLGVCFSAVQAVLYVAGRHRLTIEPTMELLAAAGMLALVGRIAGRGEQKSGCKNLSG